MFKKLYVSLYNIGAVSLLKRVVRGLVPDEWLCRFKSRIIQSMQVQDIQSVWDRRYFVNLNGKIGVNISGFLRSGLGLGESARNVVKALASQGIRFVLNDNRLYSHRKIKTDFASYYQRENPYLFNLVNVNPDMYVFYYSQSKRRYFDDRYNIGVWYWEARTFPEEWVYYFRFFHEIWVATDFIRDAVSISAPIPVVKMPTVVRVDPEPVTGRSYFNIPGDCYVFLFVFDFYSTTVRKNPQAIIRAFKTAFGGNNEAMLYIKTMNGRHFKKEFQELVHEIGGSRNIKLVDDYLEREKLNSLINISDCYVSLHRSEGFGMGIAEAMMLGKPVIVTAYSGNMDFTNEQNSFLVKYKLTELEKDTGPYSRGCVWAEPDDEHAAKHMLWVLEHNDEARAIGKRGMESVRGRYTVRSAGKNMKQRLDSILHKLQG